jgi:hypothetical protein
VATWYGGHPAHWSRISFDGSTDKRERKRLLALFEASAESAARAAGARSNTVEGWLNLLRKESPHFSTFHSTHKENGVDVHSEGGWIQHLALASAEYCIVCRNRAERSMAWKERQAQFEKYAGQYKELRAIWKGASASWILWYGDKPEGIDVDHQCAGVFKAVAGQAAAGLSGITRDAESWEQWLDAMRARRWGFQQTGHTPCTEREWDAGVKNGKPLTAIRREQKHTTGDEWKEVYRRTKNGKLRRLSARELRGKSSNDLQKYYHWLEDGKIEQVFAASARFCEELAARGEITSKEANSATADQDDIAARGFEIEAMAGDGPIRDRQADWREDAAFARECPAFLRPAIGERLAAIAKLRKDAAEGVQRAKPQARQDLEQCLWPPLSEYAVSIFDKMAEAELGASGSGVSPEDYGIWLRSKCVPAVIDDVCRPIFGQFVISVRYIAEILGDVHCPEDVRMRSVLWTMYAEEQIPQSSTKSLENRLTNVLQEERAPHWEARAAQPRPATGSRVQDEPPGKAISPAPEMATPSSSKGSPLSEHASFARTPRRVPNLDVSRERLRLLDALATELATLKQDMAGYCTPQELKNRHPGFLLWAHLNDSDLKELVDGEPFFPKRYAETLTLRKFGITSRETLKKDRQKLRKVHRSQPSPPSS